jgi:hypothetical protein
LIGKVAMAADAGCTFGCGSLTEAAVDLYFPQGRVAGAPVVMDPLGTERQVGRATLDSSLTVAFVEASDRCGNRVRGALVGPDDGLRADLLLNPDPMSDALHLFPGTAVMCPSGSIPAPAMKRLGSEPIVPGETIDFSADTPISQATLTSANVAEAPGAYASVGNGDEQLRVAPANGRVFVPGALSLDLREVTDVLGRPYLPDVYLIEVLKPAGTIADGGADAGVAASAIAAAYDTLVVANGTTTVSPKGLGMGIGSGYAAVIGLGAGTGATTARVVHRFICTRAGDSATGTVTIVSSDGSFAPVAGSCSEAPTEVAVILPGPGPHYLVVKDLRQPLQMQCSLASPPVWDKWELTSVTLEP